MPDLVLAGRVAQVLRPDPVHLAFTNISQVNVFLVIMHSKAAQKARQPFENKTSRLGPQDKVPVKRKIEAFIKRPNGIPNATAPKQRFLRNVVSPFESFRVMGWQDATPDLKAVD